MPSRRPVKPRPSVVVAFTLTREGSSFRISAILAFIGITVRADLGPLADDGDIDMADDPALGRHQRCGMVEEFPRRRAAPAFVGGRKMLADIAFADTAQDRIGDGMQADIGVGMAFQSMGVRIFRPHSQIWSPSVNLCTS